MKYSKRRTLADQETGEIFEVLEKVKADKEGNIVSRCFTIVSDPSNLSLETNSIVSTDKLAPTETEKLAKKKVRPTWMHAYILQTAERLAAKTLSLTAYRVWFALPTFMTWGNYVNCSLSDIADKIGVDAGNISRAIKELAENDLIVKTGRSSMMANPNVCWLGYANDQQKGIAEYHRYRIKATAKAKADKKAKAKKAKAKPKFELVNLDDYRDTTTAPPA